MSRDDMEALIERVALPWLEEAEQSFDTDELAKAGQAVRALLKAYREVNRQEINRLRFALVEAGMRIETCPGAYKNHVEIIVQKIRAALTGEDTAGSPTSRNTQPGLAFSDAGER
jgi:AcrR family transcriptional regulator